MSLIRLLYRLVALLVWFTYTGTLAFFSYFGGWPAIKRVSNIAKLWGTGICSIMNIKIRVNGDPQRFEGGLLVSNHLSYLDILVHSAVFPLRFAPKKDIASWPVLGWYLHLNHPVWVDRRSKQASKKTMQEFKETLEHDISLIVYPEGTSTDGKSGLKEFKSTPFEAAVNGNFPIFPILTVYNDDDAPWYGDMTLLPHVMKFLTKRKTDVDIYLLDPIFPEGKDRKETAKLVHNIMDKKYRELTA